MTVPSNACEGDQEYTPGGMIRSNSSDTPTRIKDSTMPHSEYMARNVDGMPREVAL